MNTETTERRRSSRREANKLKKQQKKKAMEMDFVLDTEEKKVDNQELGWKQ